MNSTSRLALLVLLASAAAGVLFVLGGEDRTLPDEMPPEIDRSSPAEAPEASRPIQTEASARRREIAEPFSTSGRQYDQGITGTVNDPVGAPVSGARAYLMESMNTLQVRLAMQNGIVFLPLATDRTDERGQFALGLSETTPGKVYEVRILTDLYVDHRIANLTIQDNDWYDARIIRLERGTVVYGRVTLEGQGTPVPGATIYIGGGSESIGPIPGREQGLEAQTNDQGYFQVQNAPKGIVEISAGAPNFARVHKANVSLDPVTANEVNFELVPGR